MESIINLENLSVAYSTRDGDLNRWIISIWILNLERLQLSSGNPAVVNLPS